MRGLLIRQEPLRKILDGKKTWEMRGSATKIRGTIALIQSKSGKIVGTADLVDCIGPISAKTMKESGTYHCVDAAKLATGPLYPKTFAWVLANARELLHPIDYKHPSGAVIWVKLDDKEATIKKGRNVPR